MDTTSDALGLALPRALASFYSFFTCIGLSVLWIRDRKRHPYYYRRLVGGIVLVSFAGTLFYGGGALRSLDGSHPWSAWVLAHPWGWWVPALLLAWGYTLHLSGWLELLAGRAWWLLSAALGSGWLVLIWLLVR